MDSSTHSIGKYDFIPELRELWFDLQIKTKLTDKESKLLYMLIESRDAGESCLPRERVLNTIWEHTGYRRSMDVYISKLRKHLKSDTNVEIISYHGEGHKLLIHKPQ